MRTRQWLFAMTIFCGGVGVIGACSSDDSSAPPPNTVDSGAKGDACTPVNLTTIDAGTLAINGDGATTGTCLTCMRAKCTSELSACSDSCFCSTAVSSFVECLGSGQGNTCFTTATASVNDPAALNDKSVPPLLRCMVNDCVDQCGIDLSKLPGFGDAGSTEDSGATPSGDAATGG